MADHYILRLRGDREDVGANDRGITIFPCRMIVFKVRIRHKDSSTVSAYDKAIQYEDLEKYIYLIKLLHDAKIQCFAEVQHHFGLICNYFVQLCYNFIRPGNRFKDLHPSEGLLNL